MVSHEVLVWGSCRISTPAGGFYLCSTEEEAEQLRADSAARAKPRAVFSREELGSQMERLEPVPKEERLDWLKTMIALKCELSGAKVEAIQTRKRSRHAQDGPNFERNDTPGISGGGKATQSSTQEAPWL